MHLKIMMKYYHYRVETRENRTQMSSFLHSCCDLASDMALNSGKLIFYLSF